MRYLSLLLIFYSYSLNAQHMDTSAPIYCDPETGLCTISPIEGTKQEIEFLENTEIIYVGDPMCSWCWGISPALHQLEHRAATEGIPFRIVVGGLRPGGGDPWNEQFRNFLKHHWEEVNQRSGQPFGDKLFDRDTFNYDTEPSCRAVVAARTLAPDKEHRFFELVQHYFYVRNEDPTQTIFYEQICDQLELDYAAFVALFQSEDIKAKTRSEFQMNRQWGVRGYPTVLFRKGEQLFLIAGGYADFEQMWSAVEAKL